MIKLHHLGVSQSERVVWLMEELQLPYELVWHDRGEDRLMQQDYLDLHPAGTAPVIEDDGRVLTESAVILEYICHTYAGGALTLGPSDPNYYEYLYWMHFNNNILGLFFAKAGARDQSSPEAAWFQGFMRRREDRYFDYLEQRLGEVPYLAGDAFTCADIMVMFDLTFLARERLGDASPSTLAYVERVSHRPAYVKAMALAGAQASRPKTEASSGQFDRPPGGVLA